MAGLIAAPAQTHPAGVLGTKVTLCLNSSKKRVFLSPINFEAIRIRDLCLEATGFFTSNICISGKYCDIQTSTLDRESLLWQTYHRCELRLM